MLRCQQAIKRKIAGGGGHARNESNIVEEMDNRLPEYSSENCERIETSDCSNKHKQNFGSIERRRDWIYV